MTSPDQSSPSPRARRLGSFFKIGTLIVLCLGAISLFIDWRTGSQFTRPWLQISFTTLGVFAIGCAAFVPKLSRPQRVLLSGAGLLILLAVIDSLDGHQVSALRAGGRAPTLGTVPHTAGTPDVASVPACTRPRRQSP
jgi:hypothetical protein